GRAYRLRRGTLRAARQTGRRAARYPAFRRERHAGSFRRRGQSLSARTLRLESVEPELRAEGGAPRLRHTDYRVPTREHVNHRSYAWLIAPMLRVGAQLAMLRIAGYIRALSWEARPRGERRRQPAISQLRKPQSASPNDSAHSGRHCPARQRCTSCRASSCISLRVTPLVQPKPSCKGYSPPPACSALGRSTYFSTSLLSRSNS